MPSARQAISSSRSASQARPIGSRRSRMVIERGDQRQHQDHVVEKDRAVDRVELNPEARGEAVFAVDEGNAEEGRPRHAADAGIAVGQVDPVDQHQPDDLAEGERHDGEIVAAQPQHREAEQDAPERGKDARDRQQHPERPRPKLVEIDGEVRILGHEGDERQAVLGQQREGIGADRVEGDVAEVEQAGEADHDIEAPAEHHVDQDLDAEIVDPFDRALRAGQPEHHQRIDEQESERAHAQPEADLMPAVASGFGGRRIARADPRHAGPDDEYDRAEGKQIGEGECDCALGPEADLGDDPQDGRGQSQAPAAAASLTGDRKKTASCSLRRSRGSSSQISRLTKALATNAANSGQRVSSTSSLRMSWTARNAISGRNRPNAMRPVNAAARSARTRSGARRRCSPRRPCQTFSTSGRPSRPCGRKIITTTRIEKAATSL